MTELIFIINHPVSDQRATGKSRVAAGLIATATGKYLALDEGNTVYDNSRKPQKERAETLIQRKRGHQYDTIIVVRQTIGECKLLMKDLMPFMPNATTTVIELSQF